MSSESTTGVEMPDTEARSFEELQELADSKGLELDVLEPDVWLLRESEHPVRFVDGSYVEDSIASGDPVEVIEALDAYPG